MDETTDTMPELTVAGHTPRIGSGGGPRVATDAYWFNTETRVYNTVIPGFKSPVITTEDEHKAIVRQYSRDGEGATVNQLCKALGWSRHVVRHYLRAHNMTHDREPFTVEELLERDADDLATDAIEIRRAVVSRRVEIRRWEQIQINAEKWERWQAASLDTLIKAFVEGKIGSRSNLPAIQRNADPFIGSVDPRDLHFGARWNDGTGRRETRQEFLDTLSTALATLRGIGRPERIVFAGLDDWQHVDYDTNATRHGTLQDVDCDFPTLLQEATDLYIAGIDMCAKVAPVLVLPVTGNHNPNAAVATAMTVRAWYRQTKRVVVEPIAPRHYLRYGQTLACYVHKVKTPRKTSWGDIMLNERREDCGDVRWRVVYGGHEHHERVEDQAGTKVQTQPTIARKDRYSHGQTYQNIRALAVSVIGREKGPYMQINEPVVEVGNA